MSAFEVKTVSIDRIEKHPNADVLDLAIIGEYRAIVRIGEYKAGDLVVYIPEGSVVPQWLLAKMGLEGKLAGKDTNRVKAIKLRGILSQGLVYPVAQPPADMGIHGEVGICFGEGSECITTGKWRQVRPGDDVSEFLGITKYEPPIPTTMSGEVANLYGYTLPYDIENLKKFPQVFEDGEQVVMTEKIHGTFCGIGYWPGLNHLEMFYGGDAFVFSKGLGGKGLAFKNNEINKGNIYVRELLELIDNNTFEVINRSDYSGPVYILGEIFGEGVQDLSYGQHGKNFRVFDVYVGEPGKGRFLDWSEMCGFCMELGLNVVPIIYDGPWSWDVANELCGGKTQVQGSEGSCIREGIVIKPTAERRHDELGRVILKHVSEQYLLRKNATEYQ